MKVRIEDELKGATFHVDLTTGNSILPVDSTVVENVIDHLLPTFQELTSGGESSATNPRFPVEGSRTEPESYEPITHVLNKIIDTASGHIPQQSHLSGLRFHTSGYTMKESYESFKGLKPDIVGTIGEVPTRTKELAKVSTNNPELSWEQVEVAVESKATVRDMVRQSGTYARCCVLGNERRFFSLGIGFQWKKLEAYVFAYHRAGLSSSHPLDLKTLEGFNGLVRHIVGILSFKEEAAYGLDPTRFQNIFRINNRYYEIVHPLHVRGTLRGRSTIVHSLQGMYTYGF